MWYADSYHCPKTFDEYIERVTSAACLPAGKAMLTYQQGKNITTQHHKKASSSAHKKPATPSGMTGR